MFGFRCLQQISLPILHMLYILTFPTVLYWILVYLYVFIFIRFLKFFSKSSLLISSGLSSSISCKGSLPEYPQTCMVYFHGEWYLLTPAVCSSAWECGSMWRHKKLTHGPPLKMMALSVWFETPLCHDFLLCWLLKSRLITEHNPCLVLWFKTWSRVAPCLFRFLFCLF